MKVSINWAQQFSNVDIKTIPKDELLKKIGEQLGSIEEVIELGSKYDGIVVAKVVSCVPHPDADKLHICRIDDGGVVGGMERGDDNLVQVVCGAPNVKEGMTVAWLPPGSTVPSSRGKEPFVLGTRELRGVMSNGMLASAAELAISDNHDGILEISDKEVSEALMKPGTDFKKLYDLDDLIIDCENKMFTHRPDCFGILGVARELAGITHQKFVSPEWYRNTPLFKDANDLPLKVKVESKLVSRFMAVAMDNVSVKPSPIKIQTQLTRVGIRPINNIVDISNWLMHLTGQPIHIYDYDKVKKSSKDTATLIARQADKDEKVKLLSEKSVVLDESNIIIATDKHVIGLAGVMGGSDTEVDNDTKSIIIEIATFDMYSIRRTAMKHGIFTDAVTRFNKGQSPLQNDRVMAKAMAMVHEYADATQASRVIDIKDQTVKNLPTVNAHIDFINTRLGSSLTVLEATNLLENVECVETVLLDQEIRSYLTSAGDVTERLERIGVKIIEQTVNNEYKLIIPIEAIEEYEKLMSWSIKPGTWAEYIGARSVFIFKDLDTKVNRYEVTHDTDHEIVEMCRSISNEYYTSLDSLLDGTAWYKPLLPLAKTYLMETSDASSVTVAPPFWRRDIELPEDLVEEIGRLYGFDNLPVALPKRTITPAKRNEHLELTTKVRNILSAAGANELLTYSFINADLISKVNQNTDLAYHLRNALSPDLQYYRMSITPSLLDKVHMNIRLGYESLAIYEMGRTHNKVDAVSKGEVPEEFNMLAFVYSKNGKSTNGSAFFYAKKYLNFLANKLGLELDYEPIGEMPDFPVAKPFNPERSAFIHIAGTKHVLGIIGEYKQSIYKSLKLPINTAGFEIGTKELLKSLKDAKVDYKQLLKFPKSQQDVTLEVPATTSHGTLTKNIKSSLIKIEKEHGYVASLICGDIYSPEKSNKKRISYSVTLAHPARTLTTEDVSRAIDELSRQAVAEFAAVRI
ncbi:MAG: phenylalanine--tRNA ligase subunit beta [bacterium]